MRPIVLVIDDDPNNLRVASELLDGAGFDVRTARDGETGIRRAAVTQPDVILLDVQMPGIDGFETCRRLKADPQCAAIPVIFMTAMVESRDKVMAFEAGAVDYVTKPFDFPELKARLSTQIALATLQAELRDANERLEARVLQRTQELSELNTALSRFVPDDFLATLGRDISNARLGDRVHGQYTVMFADIRSYTATAEALGPEATFDMLCAYYARIGPIISKFGGYISQYLGDGLMANFPDAVGALRSAVALHHAVDALNVERIANGAQPIRTGVGLNTGPLTLGIIGDPERLNTSIVGDTVNLAARMEGLSKVYGVRVAMSGTTRAAAAGSDLAFRFIDDVQVVGKQQTSEVFELLDADPPDLMRSKQRTMDRFLAGIDAIRRREPSLAVTSFTEVLADLPDDVPTRTWLERSATFQSKGQPQDFIARPPKR